MSLICQCPAAAAITDVPNVTCPENFGQIQKVAFQRLTKADGTKNSFTSTASILLKASWTPLLSAADGSKVVVSPYINAPADSGGDARLSSGGNDDLGGIAEVLGGEPSDASNDAATDDVAEDLGELDETQQEAPKEASAEAEDEKSQEADKPENADAPREE